MKLLKNIYWFTTNLYGKLFGWPFLARFHHTVATFSMHGLGYGNMYRGSWTGEERFLKTTLAKTNPKVVIDVGANIGKYSTKLLKYTDATVYAFEPNPSSFKELSKLPERVQKVNLALSDKPGTATLHFRQELDGRASLDPNLRTGMTEEVEVTTLENYLQSVEVAEVDFLKIDTEGLEKEVLLGLGAIRPKFIQFEFSDHHILRGDNIKDMADLLPGYTLYRLLPNGWLKVDPKSYIDNIFIFSNYIAVRGE